MRYGACARRCSVASSACSQYERGVEATRCKRVCRYGGALLYPFACRVRRKAHHAFGLLSGACSKHHSTRVVETGPTAHTTCRCLHVSHARNWPDPAGRRVDEFARAECVERHETRKQRSGAAAFNRQAGKRAAIEFERRPRERLPHAQPVSCRCLVSCRVVATRRTTIHAQHINHLTSPQLTCPSPALPHQPTLIRFISSTTQRSSCTSDTWQSHCASSRTVQRTQAPLPVPRYLAPFRDVFVLPSVVSAQADAGAHAHVRHGRRERAPRRRRRRQAALGHSLPRPGATHRTHAAHTRIPARTRPQLLQPMSLSAAQLTFAVVAVLHCRSSPLSTSVTGTTRVRLRRRSSRQCGGRPRSSKCAPRSSSSPSSSSSPTCRSLSPTPPPPPPCPPFSSSATLLPRCCHERSAVGRSPMCAPASSFVPLFFDSGAAVLCCCNSVTQCAC